jgi:hypothetical protein
MMLVAAVLMVVLLLLLLLLLLLKPMMKRRTTEQRHQVQLLQQLGAVQNAQPDWQEHRSCSCLLAGAGQPGCHMSWCTTSPPAQVLQLGVLPSTHPCTPARCT